MSSLSRKSVLSFKPQNPTNEREREHTNILSSLNGNLLIARVTHATSHENYANLEIFRVDEQVSNKNNRDKKRNMIKTIVRVFNHVRFKMISKKFPIPASYTCIFMYLYIVAAKSTSPFDYNFFFLLNRSDTTTAGRYYC